jgi:hypothetical protein
MQIHGGFIMKTKKYDLSSEFGVSKLPDEKSFSDKIPDYILHLLILFLHA